MIKKKYERSIRNEGREEGREEGIEIGLERGRKQQQETTIKRLRSKMKLLICWKYQRSR